MADYYTLFSFMVGSKSKEDSDYLVSLSGLLQDLSEITEAGTTDPQEALLESEMASEMAHLPQMKNIGKALQEMKGTLADCYSIPSCYNDGDDVWIHNDDSGGGVEETTVLLQLWLKTAKNPPDFVAFEWSNTCSKPRTDGFGGGAVFVTADEIEWLSPNNWINDKAQELKFKKKKEKHPKTPQDSIPEMS